LTIQQQPVGQIVPFWIWIFGDGSRLTSESESEVRECAWIFLFVKISFSFWPGEWNRKILNLLPYCRVDKISRHLFRHFPSRLGKDKEKIN
jgi:hypothetical protein